jgi:hypothetical protein
MPREGGGERRRERRVPCDFVFSIRCLAEPGGLASAIDLSTSGMRFLYVGRDLSPTEKILVQFTLGSSTWSFCGQPLRVCVPQPFTQEVAVVFQSVDERTRSLLVQAIRQGLDAEPAV